MTTEGLRRSSLTSLIIACSGYVVLNAIAMFAPDYYQAAFKWLQPAFLAELAIALWLLIKGAKDEALPQRVATAA